MATFSGSGFPTELINIAQALKADVKETEDKIKKEQEFCEYLQIQHQSTKESTSSLQEKCRELDENVKRLHDVFVSHKKSSQRAKDNIAVLDEQIRTKTACLEQFRNKCTAKREAGEKKLRDGREKFEQYMKIYETFPLVPEYLREKQKLCELEQREEDLLLKIQGTEDAIGDMKKQKKEVSDSSRTRFASITQWATSAAKKYVEIKNRKHSKEELQDEIRQLKDRIEARKEEKAAKDKERAMAEEMKRQRDAACYLPVKTPPANSATQSESLANTGGTPSFLTRYKDFFKKSSNIYGNFFRKREGTHQQSQRQGSEPNLQLSAKELPPTDFEGKVEQFAKSPLSLFRSQSMTALARGSSGSATAPMTPTSSAVLDGWLATKEQFEGKAHEVTKVRANTEGTQPHSPISPAANKTTAMRSALELQTAAEDRVKEDTTEKMDTERPPESASSPPPGENLHLSFHSFAELCKSPEDDFKFAARKVVAPQENKDSSRITAFLSSADSPWSMGNMVTPPRKDSPGKRDDTPRAEDFPFAVPSAPPPGRRHGVAQLERATDSKMVEESSTQQQRQMLFSGTSSLSNSFGSPAPDSGIGSMNFQSSMDDFSFSLGGVEAKSPQFSLFGSGQQQQSFDMLDSSEQSLGGLF